MQSIQHTPPAVFNAKVFWVPKDNNLKFYVRKMVPSRTTLYASQFNSSKMSGKHFCILELFIKKIVNGGIVSGLVKNHALIAPRPQRHAMLQITTVYDFICAIYIRAMTSSETFFWRASACRWFFLQKECQNFTINLMPEGNMKEEIHHQNAKDKK